MGMSGRRMSRRPNGIEQIPPAKNRRRSRHPNRTSSFKSTPRFQMENRFVQYRRNHRSPSSADFLVNNEEIHSDKTGNGRTSVIRIRGLSSVSARSHQEGNESLTCWKSVSQLRTEPHLEETEETFLHSKQHFKENWAEDHPLYAAEWKSFWEGRQQHYKLNEKDSLDEDLRPDWIKYWNNRMNDIALEEEKKTKETTQFKHMRESHQGEFYIPKECNSEYGHGSRELEGERWSLKKSLDHKNRFDPVDSTPFPVHRPVGVRRCRIKSSLKASLSDAVGVSLNPKRICHVIPTQISRDAPLPSDKNLITVLRLLVILEDYLGSLGPSITNLLARALSAERCEIGSASKLLIKDQVCIDLLDTSKEKLKGLLLAGILDGVKLTAASQAVEYVTHLLKQSSVTSHSCTSMDGPMGNNAVSQVNNLQADGLLRPLQSTPILLSAIGCSSVAKKDDPSLSAENLNGSRNEKFDQFSGEELKILIVNFLTLTASQKRDLVKYLRQLEERFPEKDVSNSSEQMVSSSTSCSSKSRLSKKFDKYEKDNNSTAPDQPLSKIRFPFISKKTGLSSIDLDNYGIPLDELDSQLPTLALHYEISLRAKNNEELLPSTVNHQPCSAGINRSDKNDTQFQQSTIAHQQSTSWAETPLLRNAQSSCQMQVIHGDEIQRQKQELDSLQLQRLSYYNAKLDPRRNRVMHRSVQGNQINPHNREPIVIPTSPL